MYSLFRFFKVVLKESYIIDHSGIKHYEWSINL